MKRVLFPALLLLTSRASAAPEPLGLFSGWGAFRASSPTRCYAVTEPARRPRQGGPFLTVSTWPERRIFRAVHLRLRRPAEAARLLVGERRFDLALRGMDAWPRRAVDDRPIIVALRSGQTVRVEWRSAGGHRFVDHYLATGAASAIDAADIACMGQS